MAEHGIATVESDPASDSLRDGLPAIPTCGLAVAEAERAMPSLVPQAGCAARGAWPREERISFRMSGCPNGCSRPYLGDGLRGPPRWASTT